MYLEPKECEALATIVRLHRYENQSLDDAGRDHLSQIITRLEQEAAGVPDVMAWVNVGELEPEAMTRDEFNYNCGRLMDKSCAQEILNEPIYLGTNGYFYSTNLEAHTNLADPAIVAGQIAMIVEDEELREQLNARLEAQRELMKQMYGPQYPKERHG